jgi:hypothetical protein
MSLAGAFESVSRRAALAAVALLFPILMVAQNYVFGPNVRVSDDSPGLNSHSMLSEGLRTIAARGDTVYVVWDDDRTGFFHVYFARSTDAGQSFQPNLRLDTNNGSQQEAQNVNLAVDGNGGVHVCWLNGWPHPGFIYYTKSTDGGATFSWPILVGDTVHNGRPAVAVSDDGQRVFIVRDTGVSGQYGIVLCRSTDGGQTFLHPETRVSPESVSVPLLADPTVAVYRDTVVLVAWSSVYVARSFDAGVSFADSATFVPGGLYPCIATDSLGRVYVAWQGARFSTSDDLGSTFSVPRVVSPDPAMTPSLWVTKDGRVFLAYYFWNGNYGRYHEVRVVYSPNRGDTFQPPVNPSDGPNDDDEFYPTVAANEQGRAFVAWEDNRNDLSGPMDDIYFAAGALSAVEESRKQTSLPRSALLVLSVSRGTVTVKFSEGRRTPVRIDVLTEAGSMVRHFDGTASASGGITITWDGCDEQGRRVASGVCFIRARTSDRAYCQKTLFINN